MLSITLPSAEAAGYLASKKSSWTFWACSRDSRFTPESDRLLRCRETTLRANRRHSMPALASVAAST